MSVQQLVFAALVAPEVLFHPRADARPRLVPFSGIQIHLCCRRTEGQVVSIVRVAMRWCLGGLCFVCVFLMALWSHPRAGVCLAM